MNPVATVCGGCDLIYSDTKTIKRNQKTLAVGSALGFGLFSRPYGSWAIIIPKKKKYFL